MQRWQIQLACLLKLALCALRVRQDAQLIFFPPAAPPKSFGRSRPCRPPGLLHTYKFTSGRGAKLTAHWAARTVIPLQWMLMLLRRRRILPRAHGLLVARGLARRIRPVAAPACCSITVLPLLRKLSLNSSLFIGATSSQRQAWCAVRATTMTTLTQTTSKRCSGVYSKSQRRNRLHGKTQQAAR